MQLGAIFAVRWTHIHLSKEILGESQLLAVAGRRWGSGVTQHVSTALCTSQQGLCFKTFICKTGTLRPAASLGVAGIEYGNPISGLSSPPVRPKHRVSVSDCSCYYEGLLLTLGITYRRKKINKHLRDLF